MAAPTPVTNSKQSGHYGWTAWRATWADGTQLTDSVVVDLSGLGGGYTNRLKVIRGFVVAAGDVDSLSCELEFDDDTADELIVHVPQGSGGAVNFDFSKNVDGGIVYQGSGGTGDIVLTTLGADTPDGLYVYIEWEAS